MIGDRLDTDVRNLPPRYQLARWLSVLAQILFGLNGGVSTLAVLTGVNKLQDFNQPDSKIKPKYYVNSLGDLSILAHNGPQQK